VLGNIIQKQASERELVRNRQGISNISLPVIRFTELFAREASDFILDLQFGGDENVLGR
jgi:hypothetical protein